MPPESKGESQNEQESNRSRDHGFQVALLACSSQAWAAVDTVTSLSGSATTPGSLGYEIANASSGDSIVFQNGLSGTITLSSAITVSQDLTITGPGAGQLAVSGGGQSQIFDVTAPTVLVSGLTVTDAAGGAVIVNPSVPGSLTVSAMTFSDDTASGGDGGAIDQESGVETMTVAGSTFTDDAASFGGAIWDKGSLISVSNSIFTRDSATNDGGVYYSEEGSALHVSGSSFTQDSAGGDGGAINNSQETWVSAARSPATAPEPVGAGRAARSCLTRPSSRAARSPATAPEPTGAARAARSRLRLPTCRAARSPATAPEPTGAGRAA